MKKFLLQADYAVQALLLIPTLTFGIFVFPLILMVPLGGWQVASAFIKGAVWRSRFHLTYFGLAVTYCLALWVGFSEIVEVNCSNNTFQKLWYNEVWGIFFVVVIPLTAAFIYWRTSYDDCTHYSDEKLV